MNPEALKFQTSAVDRPKSFNTVKKWCGLRELVAPRSVLVQKRWLLSPRATLCSGSDAKWSGLSSVRGGWPPPPPSEDTVRDLRGSWVGL